MQYKFFGISIAFGVFFLLPFHQAYAQWCDPLFGLCGNPFENLSTEVPQVLKVAPPPQPYTPPPTVPVQLQQVVIPQNAYSDAFTSACVADPANCASQQTARNQCIQGNGNWTYSYGTGSIYDWPNGHCQCSAGYTWITNYACVPNNVPATTKVSSSHVSGLTTAQVSAILSLLQAFGADATTIANVKAALGGQ